MEANAENNQQKDLRYYWRKLPRLVRWAVTLIVAVWLAFWVYYGLVAIDFASATHGGVGDSERYTDYGVVEAGQATVSTGSGTYSGGGAVAPDECALRAWKAKQAWVYDWCVNMQTIDYGGGEIDYTPFLGLTAYAAGHRYQKKIRNQRVIRVGIFKKENVGFIRCDTNWRSNRTAVTDVVGHSCRAHLEVGARIVGYDISDPYHIRGTSTSGDCQDYNGIHNHNCVNATAWKLSYDPPVSIGFFNPPAIVKTICTSTRVYGGNAKGNHRRAGRCG